MCYLRVFNGTMIQIRWKERERRRADGWGICDWEIFVDLDYPDEIERKKMFQLVRECLSFHPFRLLAYHFVLTD